MNLYFLRHASAGTSRPNPIVDAKRRLDKEGLHQCWLMAQFLNALDVQFDAIVSSPLKRALQTASSVANEIGHDAPIIVAKQLAPGASFHDFRALLDRYANMDNIMVVGHNPNLTTFLSTVIGSPNGRAMVRLRKGALARVDMSQRPPTLQWLVAPPSLGRFYASVGKSSRRKTSRK
jgi:phosphohistidine phosphatase